MRAANKLFHWMAFAVAALSAASPSPAAAGATFNSPVDVDAMTGIERQLATLNTMKDSSSITRRTRSCTTPTLPGYIAAPGRSTTGSSSSSL